MDEITIAYCYAHLWLHIYRKKSSPHDHCTFCEGIRPAKPRYVR